MKGNELSYSANEFRIKKGHFRELIQQSNVNLVPSASFAIRGKRKRGPGTLQTRD